MSTPVDDYTPEAHYDRVTEAWRLLMGDELHYGVFADPADDLEEATRALTDRMLAAAALAPGLDVLDVGCGTGAQASRLAGDHGVRVLGITTSEVGVATATARAAALGVPGARFEVRDGTANGLPSGSFDRVWVLESSHLMRDRDALVAECARVLRPGGRVVLCDLVAHREIPFREVRARREDFAVLREAFGDAHLRSLDSYADAFRAAGLDVGLQDDLSAATRPTFTHWRARAERYATEVDALIGEQGRAAFVRSCDILEGLWDDGTFGYGLIAAVRPG